MARKKNDNQEDESNLSNLSRRATLGVLGSLGILSLGTGNAAADGNHVGETWSASGVDNGLRIEGGSDVDQAFAGVTYVDDGTGFLGWAKGSGYTEGVKGQSTSVQGRGVFGANTANSGTTKGVEGRSESSSGKGVFGYASNGSGTTYGVEGRVASPDGYGLYTQNDAKIDGTLEVLGDIEVSGIKNFVQTVSSDAGPKQVKYTSVEAGEPQTEHSDVVEMEDGVAVVELPDHFGMVTSDDERLAVQVTPYCDEPVQPQVTDRSTDRIVVKDFGDGPDEYEFAYTVKGIRHGFEDQDVVTDL